MQADNVISELLERACPSIRYRLRREVLEQSPSDAEMRQLQDRILQDDAVKEVNGWQQSDGWLAWNFHGAPGMESGIRLLCEKGVDRDHPLLSGALRALEAYPDRLDRGIGKVGKLLDDHGLGGSLMIRAFLLACLGSEDQPQIDAALAGFRAILAVSAIAEISEVYRGKLVFKPGATLPGIYHLRLLALTQGWRTPENMAMVAASIQRLVELSPIPEISARHKSQVIAPASFAMRDFNPDMAAMDAAAWMMWFHRMELLARLGVAHLIPELQAQVDRLNDMVNLSGGKFMYSLQHYYFRKWSAYSGLMLERDWKSPERRVYDLTFRSLLILHFAALQHLPGEARIME